MPLRSAQDRCLAFMYDSAAANLKCVKEILLAYFFVTALGIQCLSHMFNNTGEWVRLCAALFYWRRRGG